MQQIYLIAAILGAAIPLYFFMPYFANPDAGSFISALFTNGATSGFTADLLISSFVFWIYMFSRQGSGPKPWLFIAINLLIGLSCALPAYLYFAEERKP